MIYVVRPTLIVKASSEDTAKELVMSKLAGHLNVWFGEESDSHPSVSTTIMPEGQHFDGTLLWWNVQSVEGLD